jgi:ribonuclease P protein component
MKKPQPLRLNYEFLRVYRKGRHLSSRHVVLHYLRRRGDRNRLGVTTNRAVTSSVQRNRIKRLLRESYRQLAPDLVKGYDLILVGKQAKTRPDLKTIGPEVASLMARAGLYNPPASKPGHLPCKDC